MLFQMTQDSKKNDTSIDKEVLTAFENLDMSLIKKAGPIFDGFCVSRLYAFRVLWLYRLC